MFKKAGLLTLPTPAVISPFPLSLPRQNHCPGTRLAANMAAAALLTLVSRFTPHVSWSLGTPRERSRPTFSTSC